MNEPQHGLDLRAAELRAAFDRSFALPRCEPADGRERFLILGLGADRYAVRVDALLGVERRRKIVALPLHVPGLLGLAGYRGELTAVFCAATLLGAATGNEPPAWVALCRGDAPIGLAIDRVEGSAEVGLQDVYETGAAEGATLGRQTVRIGSELLGIIDVPALVAAARQSLVAVTGENANG